MKDNPLNSLHYKRGSERKDAKLTENDVRLIREMLDERKRLKSQLKLISSKTLAEKFEVSVHTIHAISQEKTWLHVD